MNKVILTGEIGSDVNFKKTTSGLSLCNFSIMTTEKGKDGQDHKSYFDCTAWGSLAEKINSYGFRGQHIEVDGKLQKSSYTNKDGQKVYKTSVYIQNAELAQNSATVPQNAYQQNVSQQETFTNSVNYNSYDTNDIEEGMPF